jgi:hypothetical protein
MVNGIVMDGGRESPLPAPTIGVAMGRKDGFKQREGESCKRVSGSALLAGAYTTT